MRHFAHHIGDYAAATAHLSFIEDAAYHRLLRRYYQDERPLPPDLSAVARLVGARTKEERQAVANVLSEFFTIEQDGYHQQRADREIETYQAKAQVARENGTRGGRPSNRQETHPVNKSVRSEKLTTNHEPLTNNQDSQTEGETPNGVVAVATTPAEIDGAVQAFNEAAERIGWPRVQVVSKARKAGLRQRLKDCGGLEGWRIAIAKAEASDFLAGRAPPSPGHEGWRMDLDFLLMPKRFTKLMEGGYDNRAGPVPGKNEGAIEAMMRGAQSLIDSGFTPREL